MTERTYTMTRIRTGDYLCPSNDGATLWRFQRYQDGQIGGLDVDYEVRTFWRACRIPMPPRDEHFDADYLEWVEVAQMLPTRAAAERAMLAAS